MSRNFFLMARRNRTPSTHMTDTSTSMASSSVAEQVWEKTTTPALSSYNTVGKYRLKMWYSPSKGKDPIRITSDAFDTEAEARASSLSWRLSWEQGLHGGMLPAQGASQETSGVNTSGLSSPVVPLQGELKLQQDLRRVEFEFVGLNAGRTQGGTVGQGVTHTTLVHSH